MKDVQRVAIIGAGNMGTGIAQTFARAGLPVTLHDSDAARLPRVKDVIRKDMEELVSLNGLAPDVVGAALEQVRTASSLETAVAGADLVIEAVFENKELKQEVFRRLDAACPPTTISSKTAIIVLLACGMGINLSVILVMTPSVPSEAIMRRSSW